MLTETLIKLFKRDLDSLKFEIQAYEKEENLWVVDRDINNSAGNLCLHLIGNLNHFIGAVLGGSGYIRQREQEFALKNVSKRVMLKQIDDTIVVVEDVLKKLSIDSLDENYPIEVFGAPMTTQYFLVHLTTHLSYHLGQINYHRRILDL